MWDDAIFGNLTSDGQQVFVVEDLPLTGNSPYGLNMQRAVIFQPNGHKSQGNQPKTTNRLTARELKTEGKLKWEVGGPNGEDEPKLAGAFFLGPPLPLLGRLYVLAEMKGQEIRLLVLSAKTGQLEWSQQLAVVEQNILIDPFRRSAGRDAVVCRWRADLSHGRRRDRGDRFDHPFAVMGLSISARSARMVPAMAGRIVVRPNGSQFQPARQTGRSLGRRRNDHCRRQSAGHAGRRQHAVLLESARWPCALEARSRGSNLFVGCVQQDKVLLVGHNQLSAVRLSDGKPVWGPFDLGADAQRPWLMSAASSIICR